MPRHPSRRQASHDADAREPLNRERIAAAALALIDRDGLEALSMRRLGEALGVEAMALYHHFPSKGRLLDAVMDRLVAEVEMPAPQAMPPLARLRETLRRYRQLAIEHPAAFPLLVGRRFNSAGAFAFYEQVLRIFHELGLAPQQAARWFRALGYFSSGAGMADIASRELERDATPLALQRDPRSVSLPHVAAAAPFLTVERLDEVFEFGLDVLLRALEAERTEGGAGRKGTARSAVPRRNPRRLR